MNRQSAIVLLSGGLDSSIALALTQREQTIKLALHLDYGQRAARREAQHAAAVAEYLGVPFRVLELPWFESFESGLLGTAEIPTPSRSDLDDLQTSQETAKAVWVPNRNGIFIEIAAGFAEQHGADNVVVGFNREEAATFSDNSEAYLEALNHALRFSTANGVRVISPTAAMNKVEIVETALHIDFPFELLWSCYFSTEKMCGSCESCMRLKRALDINNSSRHELFAN
ncbi:MAG: 7-cyano-7-deazaguanine synthase QueC [Bdellovibrionales bacterium]|nr:7-cyano-7-deazaguanine synthase QueC [Bdellovibrionales bacterium]